MIGLETEYYDNVSMALCNGLLIIAPPDWFTAENINTVLSYDSLTETIIYNNIGLTIDFKRGICRGIGNDDPTLWSFFTSEEIDAGALLCEKCELDFSFFNKFESVMDFT